MTLTVAEVRRRLGHIPTSSKFSSVNNQSKLYKMVSDVLDDILRLLYNPVSPDVIKMLKVIINICVDERVSLLISRKIFADFNFKVFPEMNDTQSKSLALFVLEKTCHRTLLFEDQTTYTRWFLSTIYEKDNNFKDAILMLVAIPLESDHKLFPSHFKLLIFMRIARLYLEDNNTLQALSYINRASSLQLETEDMLEFRKDFIEAANRCIELLTMPLADHDRITALNNLSVFKKAETMSITSMSLIFKATT
ncbi:COP9 signalosome complex subunit 4-like [Metopolophium dirhodum]|uniref:COP9 signalosome complex subunit 4-like n=1 Tax=Metopolophium dirhodum TaxID=44670 RepID=UPI00298FAAFB|nr:COP9 signalosome complex subunit 4-like [Metopolophium dirhodum]